MRHDKNEENEQTVIKIWSVLNVLRQTKLQAIPSTRSPESARKPQISTVSLSQNAAKNEDYQQTLTTI